MAAGDGAQLPATVAASRSVEKALEEAAASGALNLSNRKLKEFPRSARNYDLSDITHADLSKNRLCELPEDLCQFISLETLSLYHNGMRSLSSSLGNLQALTYLNLSRNLLSSLPPSVFQLPLLRVLIVSNNKLSSLPASIYSLTHLRQLDVSCNELQCLPAELGQLECLRDLNLRRNQLTALPEEISELPLVRLDVSCNRISHVPLCYRHLRHLQNILLDNNPLQMPPAQICSKGKYHIFKYLNMEACKRSQEELERHLRPTGFNSCLSDQELFTGQFGGLDSGFNSVDSGSKRWSGNESADDFSERSLRMAEVSRDQRNLEEEEEEDASPLQAGKVNGEAEQVDFIDSSVMEEEEEEIRMDPPTPPLAQKERSSTSQTQDSTTCRSSLHVEMVPPSSTPSSPLSPSSPTLEERRRPGTLQIWQERERLQQQQREKASLLKSSTKTGSHMSAAPQTGSSSAGASPENSSSNSSLRQRCASADQMSTVCPSVLLQRSSSRTDVPSSPKTSPPPGQAQKPNSFLFRTSSRSSVKPTGTIFTLGESGRCDSRTTLRSPKEERPDITQLRKTLESRLKITLPEELGEALSNGTVLCQLVNQIRPRSVSIIHIPSPAVPKLSSAKCRLNVENFIAACRKLGVPEMDMCVCSDVLLCKLPAVLRCVTALSAAASTAAVGEMAEDGGSVRRPSPSSSSSSPSSSLLSSDFLFFYCAAMALLYVLYCYLLT
ncbi:leucine-rich repeat and calponin-likey domain-containing protein 4 isoform X1 [Solea senegalensis]|uniref:Leucine-rich repeat and calponin-likey domain-containing protein 4 isoform X1 n=1 Tax=Solea senegalensis TaxID=28829 RepID=A0AAV6QYY3_SOLSE|nr:leucine-rich repeat and calponin homology domain-containing protein 4 isoform X1 [Solea senegalensis]KAG7497251.1 leucine-rich repeat and calponin-likey domain-containing protein 4 isoform X1 [Solea senegalensis]